MKEKIIAKNITKRYKNQTVFEKQNLEINAGEFVSIIGESGSGKTTLLQILSANIKPDEGFVLYDDKDITKFSKDELAKFRKTEIGYVYQFYNLIPTLTAKDNIMLPIILRKEKLCFIEEYYKEIIYFLGIENIISKYPDKMSGGEQQRVAIARAMIYKPDIILLDEPTGNLDTISTQKVMDLLYQINNKYRTTIIQVTHSTKTIGYGKVITIQNGKIVL